MGIYSGSRAVSQKFLLCFFGRVVSTGAMDKTEANPSPTRCSSSDMNQIPNSTSRPQRNFRTTHWSLVVAASEDSQSALEELCTAYWPPLHWHLRRLGFTEAQAEDLTQAFFARLLEKRLLDVADSRRGRFRTFLLTALRRFVVNEWKQGTAQKRGGGAKHIDISSSEFQSLVPEGGHDLTPDRLFERQWALVVLQRAFHDLELEYTAAGNQAQFEALAPLLTRESESTSYDTLATQLQSTAGALRMAASRLRARLRELVRSEIRKTVETDADVDDEVRSLFRALQP